MRKYWKEGCKFPDLFMEGLLCLGGSMKIVCGRHGAMDGVKEIVRVYRFPGRSLSLRRFRKELLQPSLKGSPPLVRWRGGHYGKY